jgi:hypothetical protein
MHLSLIDVEAAVRERNRLIKEYERMAMLSGELRPRRGGVLAALRRLRRGERPGVELVQRPANV